MKNDCQAHGYRADDHWAKVPDGWMWKEALRRMVFSSGASKGNWITWLLLPSMRTP